ncbi:hypothetical protein [Dietzia sp. 179-F 9C3 NHS]|uniref:hypothetical protein n=1 Tax=Dietzia sp. 179-F 9C3 NHS TaxID=3374295 RepID=UPI003879A149
MRLRTSTPRRIAVAGIALATAAALTACTSDAEEGETTADTGPETSETSEAAEGVSDELPATPVGDLLLGEGEAPGEGVIQRLDPETLRPAVDRLVENQGRELMQDPACDTVSRQEAINNYVATEAPMSAISYKQSEEDETVHTFGVALLSKRLDGFLDRSLFEACTTSRSATNENLELIMTVSDAPAIPGTEGFRVTSDFVTTDEAGNRAVNRTVIVHGYARGTTTSVEYTAAGTDPAADPVLPEANNAIDEIYKAQMTKLLDAE